MQQKSQYSKVVILLIIAISCIILLNHNELDVSAVEYTLKELYDNDINIETSNSGTQYNEISNLTDTVINITDSVLIELKNVDDALKNGDNTEAKMHLNIANQKLLEMRDSMKLKKSVSEAASTIEKE